MARHRLFVALTPPAAVRVALIGAMGGVPGARWQSDEQLHVTLRFVGEVDRHQAEDIAVALDHVRHPAPTLRLGEVGTFERKDRVDTLWIAVRPRDELSRLHAKIDRALAQAGVAADPRAFLPHVTIARFSGRSGPGPEVAGRIAVPPLPPFVVRRFALYESHLGADGASYQAVAHYPLDAAD
jgi:2'-5' RNA ligase